MNSKEILNRNIISLVESLKSREIKVSEVTEASIIRSEEMQKKLNCYISFDFDKAMDKAKSFDNEKNKEGKLFGIPMAHKDMYYRKGRVSTCGSKIRKNWVADKTSTVLSRLDTEGALDIGTLNMAEFATGATGHNEHWGNCRNPWNNEHITGGSSSGSGSSVGARAVFASLGSDTGGSVRLPAAACGVVGLKPTHGLISRYGIMPLSYSMDTVGPLTRTVKDNARITDVISGYDQEDTTTSNRQHKNFEEFCGKDISNLRIGLPNSYFFEIATNEIKEKINEVIKVFQGLNVEIVEVDLPDMHLITNLSNIVFPTEACAIHSKWLSERSDEYQIQVRTRYEPGLYIPGHKYIQALDMRPYLLDQFIQKSLKNVDAMIVPGMPFAVPRIDETDVAAGEKMADTIASISWCTRPTNYLGIPALSVPCGFTENGLPTAFQLTGRPFSEGLLYQIAHAYQTETVWHEKSPS
tara:strand:+ start:4932 stop:6335 length:1404 start_codon:yes stop_codon:yes gene_type:complete